MEDYLTIKEASNLTGKSEITIRRLIKRLQKQGDQRTNHLIRQESSPSGSTYKIEKNLLLEELSLTSLLSNQKKEKTSQMTNQKNRHSRTRDKKPDVLQVDVQIVETLNKTVEILQKQLEVKDGQIKSKDNQIDSLTERIKELVERNREANHIIKGLQDRFLLTEGKKESGEVIYVESVEEERKNLYHGKTTESHPPSFEPDIEEKRKEGAVEVVINAFTKPVTDFVSKWFRR